MILLLSDHHRMRLHKPSGTAYYTPRLYAIPLLYMQPIIDQNVIIRCMTVVEMSNTGALRLYMNRNQMESLQAAAYRV